MRKKSIKKMLTVLIVVAMVFTNSGFKTVSAENTLVDFIYPNTRKLTMITDTEAKLNVDVIPRDASNQKVTFTSSNEDVAKVSSDGVVTAVSSGKTKITVKAADGGGAKETVNVTVLKNLVIDDSFVDPENDVIVIDKTYGHVTVDGSVGDADVYLAGLKIRGDLTLEAGEYNIETYDTSIENLIFAAPLEEEAEIESFSVTEDEEVDESYPSLIVGRNSKISNVNVSASALIKQAEETKIDKITFTQDKEGKITLYLDGYSGDLLLNSYLGDIEIVISNSTLGKVEVDGLEDSGNVKFTDLDGTSSLETLELKGAAKVEVQLPADEITIDRNASGASLVVGGITGTLNNAGKDSDIKIIGSVDNLETTGENTKVEVAKDALVLSINIDGKGSSLSGAGQVAEAYVNADDVNVDINNALVVIGDVTGVKVYGVEQASGSSTTSQAPVVYVPVPVEPEPPSEEVLIYDNGFEDGINPFVDHVAGVAVGPVNNGGEISIADIGYESDKSVLVKTTENWDGVGYKFNNTELATYRVEAKLMNADDASQYIQLLNQTDNAVLSTMQINGSEWTEFEQQIQLAPDKAIMFTPSWNNENVARNYYIDDFKIYEIIYEDDSGDEDTSGVIYADNFEDESTLGLEINQAVTFADIGYESSKSLKVDGTTVDWGIPAYSLTPYAGKIVTVIGVMKHDEDGARQLKTTMQVQAEEDSYPQTAITVDSGVWTKFVLEVLLPDDLTNARLFFEPGNPKADTFYIDNVLIYEGAKAQAEAEYVELFGAGPGESEEPGDSEIPRELVIFETGFEDGDDEIRADGGALEIVDTTSYEGDKSLKVTALDNWHGPQYILDNSDGTKDETYNISSYVKRGDTEISSVRYVMSDDPWTQYKDIELTEEWQEFTTQIIVEAGETLKLRLSPIDLSYGGGEQPEISYYVDNFVITVASSGEEEPGDVPGEDEPKVITLTDSTSPTYGLRIEANAVSGSSLTIDGVDNVVAVSGSAITSGYKVADIYLDENFVDETVEVIAKVYREGAPGDIVWQMYDNEKSTGTTFAKVDNAEAGMWYTVKGSAKVSYAGELYLSTDEGTANTVYYLADVVITATQSTKEK